MCIHKLCALQPHYYHLHYQLLRQCGISFLLFCLFVEGDILDCIVEFPRYALLHV